MVSTSCLKDSANDVEEEEEDDALLLDVEEEEEEEEEATERSFVAFKSNQIIFIGLRSSKDYYKRPGGHCETF